jgi:hypothetical protein
MLIGISLLGHPDTERSVIVRSHPSTLSIRGQRSLFVDHTVPTHGSVISEGGRSLWS